MLSSIKQNTDSVNYLMASFMKNRKTTSQSTGAIVSWYQITLNLEEQAILNAVRLGTLAAEHNTENKNHLESCLDLSSVNSI
jgi:hypothetical protein